jgi:hypothetical protein
MTVVPTENKLILESHKDCNTVGFHKYIYYLNK